MSDQIQSIAMKYNVLSRLVYVISQLHTITRIPSGIWSRILPAMCQRRVSYQRMVKSLILNPYMSLFNLKLWTHIWSTNINFRPSLHLTFWSVLVWTFTLWVNCGDIFFLSRTDRNVVTTQVTPPSQHAKGATKKQKYEQFMCCIYQQRWTEPMRLSTFCRWLRSAIAYCSSASRRSLPSDFTTLSLRSTTRSNVWLRISRSFFSSFDLASRMMVRHWWFSLFRLNWVALCSFANLFYKQHNFEIGILRCTDIRIIAKCTSLYNFSFFGSLFNVTFFTTFTSKTDVTWL